MWGNVVSVEPVLQGKLKTRYGCETSQFLNVSNQVCFLKKYHTGQTKIYLRLTPACRRLVCNLCLRTCQSGTKQWRAWLLWGPWMVTVVVTPMSFLRVGGQNCSRAGKSLPGAGSDLSEGAGVVRGSARIKVCWRQWKSRISG